MNIRTTYIGILFSLLFAWSCGPQDGRTKIDTGSVDIPPVLVKPYGKTIFSLDTANLQEELKRIKPEFPVFLDGDLDDPETIARMRDFITDPQLIKANADCRGKFEDLSWLEKELTNALAHYAYYFPGRPIPRVYSYVSGYDYEFRTQLYNDNLLIALDMYLGTDYPIYQQLGVPLYVTRQFQPGYITRDCMQQMGLSMINYRNQGNDLLDFMINKGKLLWFIKAMVPDLANEVLFDYTPEQMAWANQNEGLVWAFMIENEVLYSSEPDYNQKFILEGPFTSYFGQESPPRLGAYIGYKIVDHYMQRNGEVTLALLMQEYDAPKVLKGSKYKPEL